MRPRLGAWFDLASDLLPLAFPVLAILLLLLLWSGVLPDSPSPGPTPLIQSSDVDSPATR